MSCNLLEHDAVWLLCRFTGNKAAAAAHDLATVTFNGLDETNFDPDWCAYCLYVRQYACTGHSRPLYCCTLQAGVHDAKDWGTCNLRAVEEMLLQYFRPFQ